MNPWNTTLRIDFNLVYKKELVDYYNYVTSFPRRKRSLYKDPRPIEAANYLKDIYESGYGLKVIGRELGLTYTRIRSLFDYLKISKRTGNNIVTEKTRKFRSERVRGNKNPWFNWPKIFPELAKNKGLQGYYINKDRKIWLRSSWELIFAMWLDHHNIEWKYEHIQFKLSNGERYIPDFFIFENDSLKEIIEIKCLRQQGTRVNKVNLFKSDYPEINLTLVTDIKPYLAELEENNGKINFKAAFSKN